MKVRTSLAKAKEEVKKTIRAKSFSKNFVQSFLAIIVSVLHVLKIKFFKLYDFIYVRLNKILPLPFQS